MFWFLIVSKLKHLQHLFGITTTSVKRHCLDREQHKTLLELVYNGKQHHNQKQCRKKKMASSKREDRRRTLNVPPAVISFFSGNKKHCPSIYNVLPEMNVYDNKEIYEFPRLIDDQFCSCKFTYVPNLQLPGWTGLNTSISSVTTATVKTNIGYLSALECKPNKMPTINTLLEWSTKIADHLKIDNLVIVMDQAIYSKAQQTRWQNNLFQRRLVLRFGEFHTTMAFLQWLVNSFGMLVFNIF